MQQTINKWIRGETVKTVEKVTKDSERNFYLSAQEAKEYGLIDEVISSTKDIPAKK